EVAGFRQEGLLLLTRLRVPQHQVLAARCGGHGRESLAVGTESHGEDSHLKSWPYLVPVHAPNLPAGLRVPDLQCSLVIAAGGPIGLAVGTEAHAGDLLGVEGELLLTSPCITQRVLRSGRQARREGLAVGAQGDRAALLYGEPLLARLRIEQLHRLVQAGGG